MVINQNDEESMVEMEAIRETPKVRNKKAAIETTIDRAKNPEMAVFQILFRFSRSRSGKLRNLIEAWLRPKSKAESMGEKLLKMIKIPY